jgi:hypothetical protein
VEIQFEVMETIIVLSIASNRTGYTIVEVLELWMSDVPREALYKWPRYFSGSSWSYAC